MLRGGLVWRSGVKGFLLGGGLNEAGFVVGEEVVLVRVGGFSEIGNYHVLEFAAFELCAVRGFAIYFLG